MLFQRICLIALLLGLFGCGAPNVRDEQAALAQAHSCCGSLDQLPPPTAQRGVLLTLDANSPHFDFGHGLAPFVHLPCPTEQVPVLIVYSRFGASAFLKGGYGTFKYAGVEAIFLDADGKEVGRPPLSEPEFLPDGSTWVLLSRSVRVPAGAASVVLAGNLLEQGVRGIGSHKSPESAMMVGGTYVAAGGANVAHGYILSPYGRIEAHVGFGQPDIK